MTLTGFAVWAHTFARINLYQLFEKVMERARSYVVIHQIGIAMGFLLQIRMSWLRFERAPVLVLVLWSWVLVLCAG